MPISAGSLWLATLLFLPLLAYSIYVAPWRSLRDPKRLNVYSGACVALLVVWSIRTAVFPGHEFHFLGATTLTLMFGWPLALAGTTLVQIGSTLNGVLLGEGNWARLPAHALLNCAVPVLVTNVVHRLAVRHLPLHFFIYIFLCAFAAGGLSMALSRAAGSLFLALGAADFSGEAVMESLAYLPLMALPEAFLNGMVITLLVAYKPEWVVTFDDQRYLKGK